MYEFSSCITEMRCNHDTEFTNTALAKISQTEYGDIGTASIQVHT